MNIRDNLKNRRKEIGLTMNEVAKKVGVSEATVSRWESGDIANMRRDKIVLLANALQVSPSFIMGWEEENATPYDTTTSNDPVIEKYNTLNTYGKHKVEAYIDGLMENPDYIDNKLALTEKERRTPTLREAMEMQKPRPVRSDRLNDDGYERIAAYGRGVSERKKEEISN